MYKLVVPVIALAMLFSNIVAAEELKRSSVDRYSIKGIKIGMSVAEVKEILPELHVVSTSTGEEYFELHTKRPSKIKKGGLKSQYEGKFFHDQLTRIKTSETYDKLNCKQIRDNLHDKYGKRMFIRTPNSSYKFPQQYTVEAKLENRIQKTNDPVKDSVINKFEVVGIQDSNQDFRFSLQITCYEIEQGVAKYGEGSVHGVLISQTRENDILAQEAQEKEEKRRIQQELEQNKRKDMGVDEINL